MGNEITSLEKGPAVTRKLNTFPCGPRGRLKTKYSRAAEEWRRTPGDKGHDPGLLGPRFRLRACKEANGFPTPVASTPRLPN